MSLPDQVQRQIDRLRADIDAIDDTVCSQLRERERISREIGLIRVAAGGTRVDGDREWEIVSRYVRALGTLGRALSLAILDRNYTTPQNH